MDNNFDPVWGRIREATGMKSLQNLADVIQKTQPAISKARTRNEFPPGWAYLVAKKYGLLTEWIMTGEGPKRVGEAVRINPLLVEVNEWLNAEKKHNNEEFKILFEQQMIRAFFDYEKWKHRKESGLDCGEYYPSSKVA